MVPHNHEVFSSTRKGNIQPTKLVQEPEPPLCVGTCDRKHSYVNSPSLKGIDRIALTSQPSCRLQARRQGSLQSLLLRAVGCQDPDTVVSIGYGSGCFQFFQQLRNNANFESVQPTRCCRS